MRLALTTLLALAAASAVAQPPGAPSSSLEEINQMFFARYDADGNGQVTWQEFAAEPAARFQYLDRNADGMVDMNEVAAFTRMMSEQAPPTPQPSQQ